MVTHKHYEVPCTVANCGHWRWREEEDAALLAAPSLAAFTAVWGRGFEAARVRRTKLRAIRNQARAAQLLRREDADAEAAQQV